jgi:hypothetical protein
MKFRILPAALLLTLPALAQGGDRIVQVNGTVVADVRVTAFDIRNLKYTKGSASEQIATDQIASVELAKFKDVFARGLRDPGVMVTQAREQLADKNTLLAQFAFVNASAQFFDEGKAADAVAALEELQKGIPEAGLLPEVYRQKFEYYMGLEKGQSNAAQVAKKYASDSLSGAWPTGFGLEAEFFQALAERPAAKELQTKLRGIVGKATGVNPVVANRANVELAHSLRETKDTAGAATLYEEVVKKAVGDDSARAGAFLGLGKIAFEQAAAADKDAFKKALLLFLRVRLETADAWPALQAEALYYAIQAADKWRGPEFNLIMARCRNTLVSEFAGTEWAERAKAGR